LGLYGRVRDALPWRWRLAMQARYLRKTFRNGEELVRSYLTKTPCDQAICRDGTLIRHPAGRTGLAQMILEVWFEQVYTGAFYTPRPGDTIIDAGANIGLFSLLIARNFPTCQIFAFEPFDENYQLLQENLASARASRVRIFPIALAGESGFGAIVDGGIRSQDHRLTVTPANGGDPSAVRTCTLEEVLSMTRADPVALFKCDIEGSEHDLFRQAKRCHLQRVRRYAIEYHDVIRPGTLRLLQDQLGVTHDLVVRSAEGNYGMLYATSKAASK
jgi:FkbM family methyltransferase